MVGSPVAVVPSVVEVAAAVALDAAAVVASGVIGEAVLLLGPGAGAVVASCVPVGLVGVDVVVGLLVLWPSCHVPM